ncbi:MAG: sulfurtransferase TusA family protein [Gammaproteobacteria bacterium]|nr:sulfurtransferase TusA family protein [Gammaproteobacteria bacterium]
MADQELDVRGLECPLPILKTKKALNTMTSGQTLYVVATDRSSTLDFKVFACQTGNELLEYSEVDGEFRFLIKKA